MSSFKVALEAARGELATVQERLQVAERERDTINREMYQLLQLIHALEGLLREKHEPLEGEEEILRPPRKEKGK